MSLYSIAAWNVVLGLSLMFVGGLVLWAYGARQPHAIITSDGPEAASTQLFHNRLTKWFYIYGVTMVGIGALLLLWAGSGFL